jgi:hypothetical protein
VAEGLHAAHTAGILHRDVKPSNLLLGEDGALRLADFGLARVAGQGASMTTPGILVGTPCYMSPEQAAGGRTRLDERADVYSLGATLYEALTLRPPFEADSLPDLCRRIATEEPLRPRGIRPGLPRDLETIVLKALEKSPSRRYSSAAELALDLRLFAAGVPVRARPVGWAGRLAARARRHPRVALLVAAAALLAATAAGFAGAAAAREGRLRTAEYLSIVARVEEGASAGSLEGPSAGPASEIQNAVALLSEAVALRPERPEARLGLALLNGEARDARLAYLEQARDRGLGARGWRLGRAYVLHRCGEEASAREEEALADAAPPAATPDEAYLEGRILARWGRTREALPLFTRAVEGATPGDPLWILAILSRALARDAEGDLSGALRDVVAAHPWAATTGAGGRVWLASLSRRLGPLAREGSVVGLVPLPGMAGVAALVPDAGRLFVADGYQGAAAWVLERGRLGRPESIPTAGFHAGMAFEPRSRRVIVSQQFEGTLLLLDADRRREPLRVPVPPAVHHPGDDPPSLGRVVVDAARGRILVRQGREIVRYATREDGPPAYEGRFPHGESGNDPLELALDPATGRLLVASPVRPALRILDPGGAALPVEVPLPAPGGRLAVVPGTGRACVASTTGDRLFPVDLATGAAGPPTLLRPGWARVLGHHASRGLLLVAGEREDGPLLLLDARSLETRLVIPIVGGSPSALVVDEGADLVYAVVDEGWVVAIDLAAAAPR